MPTVYLESADGIRLPLLVVDTDDAEQVEQLAAVIGELACEAPPITAAVQLSVRNWLKFGSSDVEAAHEVVEHTVTEAGLCVTDWDFEQVGHYEPKQYMAGRRDVEFTQLTVEAGDLVGRFQLQAESGLPPQLFKYWAHGEGATKIRWGTPGDFTRCAKFLAEYVDSDAVKGLCANLHRDATGYWPGDKKGQKKARENVRVYVSEEFHLAGQHDQKTHGNRISGSTTPPIYPDQRESPGYLPAQGEVAPEYRPVSLRDLHGIRRPIPIRARPDDLEGPVADLYGTGDIDAVFNGAAVTTNPFPAARRRKDEPPYDKAAVAAAIAGPARLREIDPRVLHATQRSITRDGVDYYLGDEYDLTGRTYADQTVESNKVPVFYRNPRTDEWLILSGHHRSVAALIKGENATGIVIPNRTVDARHLDDFAVASSDTVEMMAEYRDITTRITVADGATQSPAELVELVRAGEQVVVASDAEAIELLELLGAERAHAERLVRWSHPSSTVHLGGLP